MKCMIGCMLQSFINNDRAVTLLLVCGVSNFLIVSGYKWSERTTRNYERLEEEAIYPPIKFMDEHKRVIFILFARLFLSMYFLYPQVKIPLAQISGSMKKVQIKKRMGFMHIHAPAMFKRGP